MYLFIRMSILYTANKHSTIHVYLIIKLYIMMVLVDVDTHQATLIYYPGNVKK